MEGKEKRLHVSVVVAVLFPGLGCITSKHTTLLVFHYQHRWPLHNTVRLQHRLKPRPITYDLDDEYSIERRLLIKLDFSITDGPIYRRWLMKLLEFTLPPLTVSCCLNVQKSEQWKICLANDLTQFVTHEVTLKL